MYYLDNKKPILFVELSGYYYSNPSLNYCLRYLETANRTVYSIGSRPCEHENVIDLLVLPKIYFKLNLLILQILGVNLMGSYVNRLIRRRMSFLFEVWIIDPEGLLLLPDPTLEKYECWYFSYEMWFKDEIGARLARLMSRKINSVDYIISTDAVRERLLVNEFALTNKQTFCWPVFAPEDEIGRELPKLANLKKELKNYKVIAFIGSIENWTMASEIFSALDTLPENYRILVNSREKSKNILRLIPKAHRYKVIVNTIPLNDFVEVMSFLKLADIGLAFYEPTYKNRVLGRNIAVMGYSSGKISTYLQAGLPVITNVDGEFKEDLIKYRSGVYAGSPANIATGVKEIEASLNAYKRGAKSHFNSVYQIPEWAEEKLL